MKRLGLIGVLLLLGGCGKEDQSFDSKPVVQGVIQYVDMQGGLKVEVQQRLLVESLLGRIPRLAS